MTKYISRYTYIHIRDWIITNKFQKLLVVQIIHDFKKAAYVPEGLQDKE